MQKTLPFGVWSWTLADRGEWCDQCSQPLVGTIAVELYTRQRICASCASELDPAPISPHTPLDSVA